MPNTIKYFLDKVVDTSGMRVLCSEDKGKSARYLPYDEAINENFIRFGNKYFIPSLSIDIDHHQSEKIAHIALEANNLPNPNFIVYTTKGLHLHWVLDKPVNTRNYKQLEEYQATIEALVGILESDLHAVPKAAGRVFRNPAKNKSKIFNDYFFSIKDFSHIIKEKEVTTNSIPQENIKQPKGSRKKSGGIGKNNKKPDFSKVLEGERNTTLFTYGRRVGYSYGKHEGLQKHLEEVLALCSSEMPQPVAPQEVKNIASSITKFIHKNFDETAPKHSVEFNRKLAKRQYDKKHTSMLERFIELHTVTIKTLKSLSFRKGGKLFGVHKDTFKKHLSALIANIKDLSNKTIEYVNPITGEITNFVAILGSGYVPIRPPASSAPPSRQ